MSSIDDRLQRVRAFKHFQSLNPDKCHVSPEAEDAIAFAAEIERLRGLLRVALPAVQSYARKHGRAVMAAARRNDADHVAKHADFEKNAWRLVDDILAALGPQADQPGHQWREAHGPIKWPHCSVCGVIQRRDGRNGPCKGPATVTTRTDQPKTVSEDGER